MNLALKDVRYHLFKFISSTIGVSLLLMVVFTLGGIIRGVRIITMPSSPCMVSRKPVRWSWHGITSTIP
jgi:hypothetical protein